MPVIAYDLLQSVEILATSSKLFAERSINGITADKEKCLEYAEKSLALVTAVAPVIGYDNAAKIYKKAMAENKPIRQAILEEKILPKEKLDQVLDLKRMTKGGRA